MTDRKLRIIIEGEDRSGGKTLRGLQKDIDGVKLSTTAMAAAAVAAGVAIKKAFDLGEAGAGLQRLEQAGHDLAVSMDADFEEIVSAIKAASLDTVATTDIIAAANRAMMLQLGADADQLANLMQVAAFRGRAMGLTTTQAFNDIVTGIGRMSPLVLDNLGIIVDAESRYQAWADKMGIATDAIDAVTKRQILFEGVLEDGNRQLADAGGLALDDAAKFERFHAVVSDAADAFKQKLTPAMAAAADVLYYILRDDKAALETLKDQETQIIATANSYEDYLKIRLEGLEAARLIGVTEAEQVAALYDASLAVNELEMRYGELTSAKLDELAISHDLGINWIANTAALLDQASALDTVYNSLGILTPAQWEQKRAQDVTVNSAVAMAEHMLLVKDALGETSGAASGAASEIRSVALAMGEVSTARLAAEAIDAINQAWEDGLISEQEYKSLMTEVATSMQGLPAAQATASMALFDLKQDLEEGKLSAEGFVDKVRDLDTELNGLPDHVKVLIDIVERRRKHGTLGGKDKTEEGAYGFQHGANFTVPPGYPADSFGPVFLSSGERVSVTPAPMFGRPQQQREKAPIQVIFQGDVNLDSELDVDVFAWRVAKVIQAHVN